MKLFRLISTTVAALLAVGALAISANAMTADYVKPQGDETGKVELAGITINAAQKTLLVLNNDAENVAEDDIVQIDQAGSFATVVVGDLAADIDAANAELIEDYNKTEKTKADWDILDAAWEESATYYVRVGGSGTIEADDFTVLTTVEKPEAPEDLPPEPEGTLVEQGYGDINYNGEPDAEDATMIFDWMFGMLEEDFTDDQYEKADINENDEPDAEDATAIFDWMFGMVDDDFQPW